MNRKMYWGVAILILLIGTAAVFIIQHELAVNRTLNEQLKKAEELVNQIKQRKIAENNPPSEEPISEQVQPMANDDVQITDFPIENSQQNDGSETVHVENYLEGLTDIDFFDSITLPTDEELTSYNEQDIMEYGAQLHEAERMARAISKKYTQQRLALAESMKENGIGKGLFDQHVQFIEIEKLLNEQRELLHKEKSRFRQHAGGF